MHSKSMFIEWEVRYGALAGKLAALSEERKTDIVFGRKTHTSINEVSNDAVDGVNHEVDIDGSGDTVVAQCLANTGSDLEIRHSCSVP